MNTEAGRVLIVEDEVNIRAGLREVTVKGGCQVTDVSNADEAIELLERDSFDLAILDIRMPGMSGVELLELIQQRWPSMAVILLTGYGTLESAIAAVRAGAQDYLLKPASPEEIRGAVRKALKRTRRRNAERRLIETMRTNLSQLDGLALSTAVPLADQHQKRDVIRIGALRIDLRARTVHRDDQLLQLSPTEFRLLAVLARRPGEAFSYQALVVESLGYDAEIWEAKELIKRHVFALRRKIEPEPGSPLYLINVRGYGYRLAGPESAGPSDQSVEEAEGNSLAPGARTG